MHGFCRFPTVKAYGTWKIKITKIHVFWKYLSLFSGEWQKMTTLFHERKILKIVDIFRGRKIGDKGETGKSIEIFCEHLSNEKKEREIMKKKLKFIFERNEKKNFSTNYFIVIPWISFTDGHENSMKNRCGGKNKSKYITSDIIWRLVMLGRWVKIYNIMSTSHETHNLLNLKSDLCV